MIALIIIPMVIYKYPISLYSDLFRTNK